MSAKGPPHPELVDALLGEAGLAGPWTLERVHDVGWINTNATIRLGEGERVVVRTYGWPFASPSQFDRAAKEAWLHPLLAAAEVPVAEVLAVAEVGARRGALLSWLPGEPLGVAAQRVEPADLVDAWHDAGAALARAHQVDLGAVGAGWLAAGGEVLAMPGRNFSGFHRERIAEHSRTARTAHPELGIDPEAIDDLVERCSPHLDRTRAGLGHSDAHAWNVMVTPDSHGRWQLSGWLDWEFAWIGDPAWDHMRMTVQRFAPIGPTPEAWFDGYGTHPPPLNLAVAILHFMLWKASDPVDTRDHGLAIGWLADLPVHLRRLPDLLRDSS